MADIPLSKAVPQIYVPSLSVPQIKVPQIQVPQIEVPGKGKYKYKKPERKHVVDLGDLVFGGPFGTRQLKETLEDNDLGDLQYLPIINKIVGTGLLIKERAIDPLSKGDFKTLGINTLETVGGNLDTLANPVKSLVPWCGGGTSDDFLRSMGWKEGEYRKTYQSDTGFIVTDILSEILLDPLTYVSIGASSVGKSAADAGADGVRKVVAKELGEEFANNISEQTYKRIAKELAETSLKNADDILPEIIKQLDMQKDLIIKDLKYLNQGTKAYAKKQAELALINQSTNLMQLEKVSNLISDLRFTDTFKQYSRALKIRKGLKLLDNSFNYASYVLAPAWGAAQLSFNYVFKPGFKHLWNYTISKLKSYPVEQLLNKGAEISEEIAINISKKSKYINSDLFDKLKPLLDKYNIDNRDLQKLYLQIIHDTAKPQLNIEYINKAFLEKLKEKIPEITDMYASLNTDSLISYKDIDELINIISDEAMCVDASMNYLKSKYIENVESEMNKFFKKRGMPLTETGTLDSYPVVQQLKYIDENFLKIGDKHYGIKNAHQFLIDLDKVNRKEAIKANALLSYLGVTSENYKRIATILKSNDARTLDELDNILRASKTGMFISNEFSKKYTGKAIVDSLDYNPRFKWNMDESDKNLIRHIRSLNDDGEAIKLYETGEQLYNELIDTQYKIQKLTLEIPSSKVIDPDTNLSLIYTELDKLYDNFDVELDVPNSEVLRRVVEFNTSTASIGSDEMKLFKNNLQELEYRVNQWASQVNNVHSVNYKRDLISVETARYILDLKNTMEQIKVKDFVSSLDTFLNATDQYYTIQLSAQGRQALFSLNILKDEHLDKFIENVSKKGSKTSVTRSNLDKAVAALYASDDVTSSMAAYNIDKILATVDSVNNVNALLNTTLTSAKLPKNKESFIKNELFNLVYKHKNDTIGHYNNVDSVELLVKEYMDNFDLYLGTPLTDKYMENLAEHKVKQAPDNLFDYFKKEIAGEYGKNAEYYEAEIMMAAQDKFMEVRNEVMHNVREALTTYSKNMTNVYQEHLKSLNLTFCNLWEENNLTRYLNDLGYEYKNIISALENPDTIIYKETVSNFIQDVSNKVESEDILDIKASIKNTTDVIHKEAIYGLGLDVKDTVNKIEYTLQDAITETYVNIAEINEDLLDKHYLNKLKVKPKGYNKRIVEPQVIISKYEFDAYITSELGFLNSYDWSTANGFLNARKITDANFVRSHHLGEQFLDIKGSESILFYEYYRHNFNTAKRLAKYISDEDVEILRKSLKDFYRTSDLYCAPLNPIVYFDNISKEDLITWNLMTKNKHISNPKAIAEYGDIFNKYKNNIKPTYIKDAKYDILDRLDLYEKNSMNYEKLSEIENVVGFVNDTAYDSVLNDAEIKIGTDIIDETNRVYELDIKKYTKDPESMGEFEYIHNLHIKNDVDAFENAKTIGYLERDNRVVSDVVKDKDTLEVLRSYNIKPTDLISSDKVQIFMKEERCNALIQSINSWDAYQFRSWIDHNTDGICFIVDYNKRLNLINMQKDLTKAGLEISVLPKDNNIIIVRRTNNTITNVPYKYLKTDYIFQPVQEAVTKSFKDNSNYFYWKENDLPFELFTGDLVNKYDYELFKQNNDIAKILGDITKQKTYSKLDENGINNFFTKEISRPNCSVIGDVDAVNKLIGYCKDTFAARNMNAKYATSKLYNSAYKGHLQAIHTVNNTNKYLQLFFNNDYSLGGPMFRRALEEASDEQLESLFKRNSWTACVLKETKQGKPRVYKIYIYDKKSLQNAIEQGAICVPHEIYRNMVLTVNKDFVDSKILNMFKRTIVGTYKTLYLTTPGFLMRNGIDSAIYKNASTSGGAFEIIKNVKYEYKASKLLQQYDDIQREVFKMAKEKTGHESFNKKYLNRILKSKSKNVQKQYALVDAFMNSSASGGYSKAFEEYFKEYNLKYGTQRSFNWERWYADKVLDNDLNPTKWVQTVNNNIEQSSRFGLFLKLIEEDGSDIGKAIQEVVNTHFDYELSNAGLDLIEQIFWFSTFPLNNFMYYINDGITRNPNMLRVQMDMMELSWNDGTYTWDDLRRNDYLASQALRGNIRFELFGKDIILKTGSSVLDFYNMITDPVGTVKDRLNPFLSVATTLEPINNLNPFNTQVNNIKTIMSGRSLVPSVYTTLQQYQYNKRHYIERKPYIKNSQGVWTAIPKMKKVPKPRNQWKKNYRIYTKPYIYAYKNVYYNWVTKTQGISPYFLNINNKLLSKDKKFRRAIKKLKMPGLQ